jgi:hypothetical protein
LLGPAYPLQLTLFANPIFNYSISPFIPLPKSFVRK